MNKLVSRLVLALSFLAAPAVVLAPSAPASACGPYADTPAQRVRRAALEEAVRTGGDGVTVSIHSQKIDQAQAVVVVRFQHAGAARATVQALYLTEDAGGQWRVTGRSYPLDERSVSLLERA